MIERRRDDPTAPPISGEIVERSHDAEHDAEIVEVQTPRLGVPVDPPDEPRTLYAGITGLRQDELQPVMPAWVRNRQQRRQVSRSAAGYGWYVVRFQAVRVPKYAAKAAVWAPVGACRLAGRQLRWWWVSEQYGLRQEAANRNEPEAWLKLHAEAKATRLWRAIVLAGEVAALVAAVALLAVLAPWWGQLLAAAVAVLVLARLGRPVGRPIVDRVSTGPRFVRLTAEMTRAALCSIGLAAIKDPASLGFARDIHRDGPGWLARVNLPAGVEAVDVIERRGRLSSALRLPVDQVWPEPGLEHAGQLDLWVGFQPTSQMGRPRWELVSPTARTNLFEPIPFGTDQRQRPVRTTLFQRNFLIGGQPGSGKTFAGRAIVIPALLDPLAEVWLAAFKPAEDFHDLSPFCTRYVCGIDDATIRKGERMVADGLREVHRRQTLVGKLKREGRISEGRTNPELAGQNLRLHPLILVFDEVHELFLESERAVADMIRLVKQGRSVFVTVVLITQVASKDSVPPEITRCVSSRWCLSVKDQVANDQIMGTGAYKRGQTGSVYRPGKDAGWGVSAGMSDEHEGAVRAYYPDNDELAKLIERIRVVRTGSTFTVDDSQPVRDVLADVLRVFADTGRTRLHWQTLAAELGERIPEAYTGITAESVSTLLRDKQVKSEDVKVDGRTLKGLKRESVEAAIRRREITAGPGSGTSGGSGAAT